MARQWMCRILDIELGPLSFSDLVEMVRAETLSEDDLVRQEGESQWILARDVIGLFATARNQAKNEESAKSVLHAWASPEPDRKYEPKQSLGVAEWSTRKRQAGVAALVLTVMTGCFYAWWSTRTPVFPVPSSLQSKPPQVESIQFPFLGSVSMLEYVLLWIDLTLAAGGLAWVCYRWLSPRRQKMS